MALARAQQMQQVYGAFAQYMGGLQGNLQSIYQAGHADGTALASGMAGPTGAVGEHLSTMAGIQNTMLDSEGKAWGDFGASMPGVYSLMATQNIKQMLNAATADQQTLRNKLLDLSSQEASDILKYLDDAKSKDVQLSEWAYGQKQTQLSQFAAAQQATLNYDLKVAQYKSEQYWLAVQQGNKVAAAKALADWHAAEQKYKYDSLAAENTRSANSIAAANARSTASITAANTRAANSLQFRRQQAMQKAGQLKPATSDVNRSRGYIMLWNPAAKTYVYAVGPDGQPIKYKAPASAAGSPAKVDAYIAKQRGNAVQDARRFMQAGTTIKSGGVTVPNPKGRIHSRLQTETYIEQKYMPIFLTALAQKGIKGGAAKAIAERWIDAAVGFPP